jgi:hypothetical protein
MKAHFFDRHVSPASRVRPKLLGLNPQISYQRTASGDALAGPMKRLMEDLEQFPALVRLDPDAALKLASSAGVLLLMSPKARSQIPSIRKLLDERRDAHPVPFYSSNEAEDGATDATGPGDLSLALEMGPLLDGLEAVGDFTSESDGGASGGGDGGGGGD